ncbi:hypothetical protein KCU99_g2291, partial [Aureobasidium melanogenum]
MDDGYQDVIRGPPVDRKPNRAFLDAALGAQMQPPGPLHWYNPAVYTQAVAGATLGANILIKDSFDSSIAYSIGGVAPEVNPQHLLVCDPVLYHNAIQNATLDGCLLKEMFDRDVARIEYHPTSLEYPPLAIRQSTEPRAFHQRPEPMPLASQAREPRGNLASRPSQSSATQATHTPRPHTAQVSHDYPTSHQQASAHRVNTQVNPHTHLLPQPRVRHASPLPEQKTAWADHKRGRDRHGRSCSPPAGRQDQDRATHYRRRTSSVGSDQFEDTTLHGLHRDHGHASHSNTTGDDAHDDAHDAGARYTPGPREPTAAAPAHRLLPATSDIQHNSLSTELCSKENVDHTINYQTPETPLELDHASALQSLPNDHGSHSDDLPEHDIHEHNILEHEHNRIQANSNVNNAYASTDIMCPAYHSWRGDDRARVVGSSMHLMALLRLGPPSSSPGYELSEIQAMFGKPNSAAEIYRRVAAGIQEGKDSGKGIDRTFVKELVLGSGAAVASSDGALMLKIDLIVKFVAEMKKPRYQEPYKREQRALRFGPTS